MALRVAQASAMDARRTAVAAGWTTFVKPSVTTSARTAVVWDHASPLARWRALGNTRVSFRRDITAQGDKKIPIPVKATPIITETIVGDLSDEKQTVIVQAFQRSNF